jgi:hypothetical protein
MQPMRVLGGSCAKLANREKSICEFMLFTTEATKRSYRDINHRLFSTFSYTSGFRSRDTAL